MTECPYDELVIWAVGIGDPCVRPSLFEFCRGQVTVESPVMGQLLAIVAAALPADDAWRSRTVEDAGVFNAWWGDCYPADDDGHWGARLAPVPAADEIEVILWALTREQFACDTPPAWEIMSVEWAVRCLLARFRALEPGVEIREYMLDCVEGAWAIASKKS